MNANELARLTDADIDEIEAVVDGRARFLIGSWSSNARALIAELRAAREALRAVEWSGYLSTGRMRCPACRRGFAQGHNTTCMIAAALPPSSVSEARS